MPWFFQFPWKEVLLFRAYIDRFPFDFPQPILDFANTAPARNTMLWNKASVVTWVNEVIVKPGRAVIRALTMTSPVFSSSILGSSVHPAI